MDFELGYGRGKIKLTTPDTSPVQVIKQRPFTPAATGAEEIERALDAPIGSGPLETIVKPGDKTVIITSDITRPVPSKLILPALLDRLGRAGVEDKDITVVFALGSHRSHTEAEMRYIVGDAIFDRVKCVDSDPADCVRVGVTPGGTPCDIFRVVAEADRRICVGNIEYHYFAGYSGGIKAIMPGVSTRAAIQSNHSRMISDAAVAGRLEGNPVRTDIEDVGKFVHVDFILNVVLDEKKTLIGAFAGDCTEAHRAGCRFLDKIYQVPIETRTDIVIAATGGYPKDINLYQAQKALDNAKYAVKEGGTIILAAACSEGMGEGVFERWYKESGSPDDLISRITTGFELGGHKAAAIALVLKKAKVFLVSEMRPEFVRSLYLEPYADISSALGEALRTAGSGATISVIPQAGSVLPVQIT